MDSTLQTLYRSKTTIFGRGIGTLNVTGNRIKEKFKLYVEILVDLFGKDT